MGIHQAVIYQRTAAPLVEIRNVWYIGGLATTAVDAMLAVSELWGWYQEHLAPILPGVWAAYGATVREVSIPGQPELDVPGLIPFVGTVAGDTSAVQTSVVINFTAPTAYPRRVRKYIGPLGELAVAGGLLALDSANRVQDFIDALVLYNNTVEGEQSFVAARWNNLEHRVDAANRVTVGNFSNVPSSLRSRKPGVGI